MPPDTTGARSRTEPGSGRNRPVPVAINARATARREIGGVERLAHEMARAPAGAGARPLPGLPPAGRARPPRRPRSGSSCSCRPRRGARAHLLPGEPGASGLAPQRGRDPRRGAAAGARVVQPALLRATSARSCPLLARRARLVITVSEFSRSEIVSRLGRARGPGAGGARTAWTSASPPPRTPEPARRASALERPYVLVVGSADRPQEPRRAGRRRPALLGERGVELVAAGSGRGYMRAEGGLAIRELGYVPEELLPGALHAAPRRWPCRPCTRASGCPASRRWRPARRWWPPTAARSPRSAATRRCSWTPPTATALADALQRRRGRPGRGGPARPRRDRARRALLLEPHGGAHRRRDRRAARSRADPGPGAALCGKL